MQAHLDRKCLVVLSETTSPQLYAYFTNEVKGYKQAWFHRTLLVLKLNISAARKWAQCFLCRKSFLFSFDCSKDLIVNLCQPKALMFVFVQNKSPNSLSKRRLRWKGSHVMHCLKMHFPNQIKLHPQISFRTARQINRLSAQTDWKTTDWKALFFQLKQQIYWDTKTNYATAVNRT